MATQSPFHLLEQFAQSVMGAFPPPVWAVEEAQRRIVLMLNHVLMQEPAATERLVRQQGRVVLVQWGVFSIRFLVTPAGLLDLDSAHAKSDLSLVVTDESAVSLAQSMLRGDRPAVRIEGDVQLAGEVNWLVDHLRWDMEEDLSRIIGDAPAHTLGQVARRMAQSLRAFARPRTASKDSAGARP
ncbi:MAG: hypothetical protein ABI343_01660 [Burkholderiaceae bacterium]